MDTKMFALALVLVVSIGQIEAAQTPKNVKVPTRGVYYVFDQDGITILDPKTKRITSRIAANTTVPGTKVSLCGNKCSWSYRGAVYIDPHYILVADPARSRCILIDVDQQLPVKAINEIDIYPTRLHYIKAMNEVWVFGDDAKVLKSAIIVDTKKWNVARTMRIKVKVGNGTAGRGHFNSGENCQNPDKNSKFGVASFRFIDGIFKIDLVQKKSVAFINTTAYCNSSGFQFFGIKNAYTSVKNYAIIDCFENNAIIVIDVAKEEVVHWNDPMTTNVIGVPYASPDGKYIVVTWLGRVVTYYFESEEKDMVRLNDINFPNTNIWGGAFVKSKNGFTLYLTEKIGNQIMMVDLNKNSVKIIGYIQAGSANTQYRIPLVGCHPEDHYIAIVDNGTTVALIDGRKKTFLGLVDGFSAPTSDPWARVWVGYKNLARSYSVCHVPENILLFFALITILFV